MMRATSNNSDSGRGPIGTLAHEAVVRRGERIVSAIDEVSQL